MSSLIAEIIEEASDGSADISGVLRKAVIASSRLNIPEMREWMVNELNGYGGGKKIPSYRKIVGTPYYLNPALGWSPIIFSSVKEAEIFSKREITQSVSELETLCKGHEGQQLGSPFSGKALESINRGMGFPTNARLNISVTELIRILTFVRNEVLNWALKLEENGVVGEGMKFSDKEKDIANRQSVTNIYNQYGDIKDSQVQHGTDHSSIAVTHGLAGEALLDLIRELKACEQEEKLSDDEREQLKTCISILEVQSRAKKPNYVIVDEVIKSVRSVLEGVAGSVAASNLPNAMSLLFP
ncbi:hypothetical protein WE348_23155 (plasmid) [Alteromonas macleodii]|uniref:AbiTii domain-containing protein n=1 Tax=Alteromonas macleodii TaxID=28108 RepID=UPI0030CD73BB